MTEFATGAAEGEPFAGVLTEAQAGLVSSYELYGVYSARLRGHSLAGEGAVSCAVLPVLQTGAAWQLLLPHDPRLSEILADTDETSAALRTFLEEAAHAAAARMAQRAAEERHRAAVETIVLGSNPRLGKL